MPLPEKLYATAEQDDNNTIIYASVEPDDHEHGDVVGIYKLLHTRVVSKKTTLKRPDEKGDKNE